MFVRVLGSAAGGGSPQWNCGCRVCSAVRAGAAPPRSQSSVVVSTDRERWFLINASPDVRTQFDAFTDLHPRRGRETPLAGVLLTDAELDHTLGLLQLREASSVQLFTTPAIHKTLRDGSGLLRLLERYCPVEWQEVLPGTEMSLAGGLCARAFDVPTTKRDRFRTGLEHGRVVGYRMVHAGRTLVYLPGVQSLTPALLSVIGDCDCLLIDGTCWSDDELVRLGLGSKTSRQMGHLPVAESLPLLGDRGGRTIYVHMNNTNPILLTDSPQRRRVEAGGLEVAVDGLELEV
ncbi:pyrroloquinoline quinone biosynthesis protein PqqB [Kineosporia mesophila]|uniref:Coenzyme PQQ synthesis protein B n=1 Tax=Kineosporia mesophila TaxID=566012 RepID=A0ABP7A9Z7_9ACTN|nr:pyrroloquinoline quinone biosynthesis protein PqqB [Kineosporia mesophila]MCD5354685.1 pyrroloquinoline quinone biosynthesis protein PqqB [Kineosporia mesophila]